MLRFCAILFISLLAASDVYSLNVCGAFFVNDGVRYEKADPVLNSNEVLPVKYRNRILRLNVGDRIRYKNSLGEMSEGVIEEITYKHLRLKISPQKEVLLSHEIEIQDIARSKSAPHIEPRVVAAMARRKAFAQVYSQRIQSAIEKTIPEFNQQITLLNSLPIDQREMAIRNFAENVYGEILSQLKLDRRQLGFVFNRDMDYWEGSPEAYVSVGGVLGSDKFSKSGKLGRYYLNENFSLFDIISHPYNQGTLVVFRTDGFLKKAYDLGKAEQMTTPWESVSFIDKEFLTNQQQQFANTDSLNLVAIPLEDFVSYPISFHEGRSVLMENKVSVNFHRNQSHKDLSQIVFEILLFKYQILEGQQP